MYYSAIGSLAIMILLIENQDILLNRNGAFELPAWKAYRKFLLAVLLYYITDILWGVLENRRLALPLFVDTTAYFIAMAVGATYWTQYTVTYLDEKNAFGRFFIYAGRVYAALVTALTILNLFVPVLFTVDGACVYRVLGTRYVVLGSQILLLLLLSAYALSSILRRHGTGKENRYRTLALFGLIMAIFLTIQLWYPYLPLYAVAYMLGTCLLRAFVIGDEEEEYRSDLEEAAKIRELKDTIVSLLDNMPGMAFTKDAKTGVYLACNRAFAEYAHKASPDDVAGLTDDQIFDAETAAHFAQDDRMALSMDEPYIFSEDVPDAAGNQRQFQTTKRKYTDTAGRLCILGMCRDMTDMVRIQRENASTKEAYEQARSTGLMYSNIAQAMASSYTNLYYVDLETDEFVEYRTDAERNELVEERRGTNFFETLKVDAVEHVHSYDRDALLQALDRKTLLDTLDRYGSFIMTYRLLQDDKPVYVTMKATRRKDDDRFIVIGVTNVDEQVKQQRAAQRLQEEQIAYSRISALTGNYICIYVVVPETGRYREFSTSKGFESFGVPEEGEDFFHSSRERTKSLIHPDDLDRFLLLFTKENVLSAVEQSGIFALTYRLMFDGKPNYVQLKVAMLREKGGDRLIVGLNDVDSQVQQEKKYAQKLAQAQNEATVDALTGIRNKHAYQLAEQQLDRQIRERKAPDFAIVVLDVNDLKMVNDTQGHQAGDLYIQNACNLICGIFKHSPVFRVGGDEFTVIAQGSDYASVDELIGRLGDHNAEARRSGGIVIACGMSKFDGDERVASVFERADRKMYENKRFLKEGNARA